MLSGITVWKTALGASGHQSEDATLQAGAASPTPTEGVLDAIQLFLKAGGSLGVTERRICPVCLVAVFPRDAANSFRGCCEHADKYHRACETEFVPSCLLCRADLVSLPYRDALCQIVGEALVENQRKQDLFRLQRSLQALVLIAYQDKAGVEACEKGRIIRLLSECFILFPDKASIVGAALEVVIALSLGGTAGRDQLGHANVPALVCATLGAFGSDVHMELKALTAIIQLAEADASNILLLEWTRAGLLVCQTMRRHTLTREILVQSITAVRALAYYELDADSSLLVDGNVHIVLPQMLVLDMHKDDRNLQLLGLGALAVLTRSFAYGNLECVPTCKAVAAAMLQYNTDRFIQLECCRVVSNLAGLNADLQLRLGNMLSKPLVQLINDKDASKDLELVTEVFRAVGALASPRPGTEHISDGLGARGVGNSIIRLIKERRHHAGRDFVLHALRALSRLVVHPQNCARLMKLNAPKLLNYLEKRHASDHEIPGEIAILRDYFGDRSNGFLSEMVQLFNSFLGTGKLIQGEEEQQPERQKDFRDLKYTDGRDSHRSSSRTSVGEANRNPHKLLQQASSRRILNYGGGNVPTVPEEQGSQPGSRTPSSAMQEDDSSAVGYTSAGDGGRMVSSGLSRATSLSQSTDRGPSLQPALDLSQHEPRSYVIAEDGPNKDSMLLDKTIRISDGGLSSGHGSQWDTSWISSTRSSISDSANRSYGMGATYAIMDASHNDDMIPPQEPGSRTDGVRLDAKDNAQDDEGPTVREGSKPPSEVQRSEPQTPTAGGKKEVKGRVWLTPSISTSTTPDVAAGLAPSPRGGIPVSSPTSGAPRSRQSTTRGSSVSPQAVSAMPRSSFVAPRGSPVAINKTKAPMPEPAVASPGGTRGSRVFGGGVRRRVVPGDPVGAGASRSESQRQLQRSGSPSFSTSQSNLPLSAAPSPPSAGGGRVMSTAGQSTAPGSEREQDGVTTISSAQARSSEQSDIDDQGDIRRPVASPIELHQSSNSVRSAGSEGLRSPEEEAMYLEEPSSEPTRSSVTSRTSRTWQERMLAEDLADEQQKSHRSQDGPFDNEQRGVTAGGRTSFIGRRQRPRKLSSRADMPPARKASNVSP